MTANGNAETKTDHEAQPYHLGCPIFANPAWVGGLFPKGTKREDFLRRYAEVFSTVEGNSTFYGLPRESTIERWIEQTTPGFRFALKFPRAISHDGGMQRIDSSTAEFLAILDRLAEADRLGPSFLQLPPTFGPEALPELFGYLDHLPDRFPYAVEVRHHDLFGTGDASLALHNFLCERRIDRVVLDSRPLHYGRAKTEDEKGARRRKPNVPVTPIVSGSRPFVRLIGRDTVEEVRPWIEQWVPQIWKWIDDGLEPYIFAHAPDDTFAPDLAHLLHAEMMRKRETLPPLKLLTPEDDNDGKQLSLF